MLRESVNSTILHKILDIVHSHTRTYQGMDEESAQMAAQIMDQDDDDNVGAMARYTPVRRSAVMDSDFEDNADHRAGAQSHTSVQSLSLSLSPSVRAQCLPTWS